MGTPMYFIIYFYDLTANVDYVATLRILFYLFYISHTTYVSAFRDTYDTTLLLHSNIST